MHYAYVTRNGCRIAGSPAVPHDVAVQAATLLNREHRRPRHAREFGVTPAPETERPLPELVAFLHASRVTSAA